MINLEYTGQVDLKEVEVGAPHVLAFPTCQILFCIQF